MIVGIGIDTVAVGRIEKIIARWGNKFLQRIFTRTEINYCTRMRTPEEHFAARFSAKEAVFKALGTGFREMAWREVEIINDRLGKPEVNISGRAEQIAREKSIVTLHVSLTHERDRALAFVIAEGGN